MIGEQFGNYRAVALLGEGGMGAVYLAEHPGIGRRVAVKVLHKNYTRDEHLLARFLNEARAANAIRHPNIIEILDSGVLGDGTPFLVMELLEGESLGARLRKNGPLPIGAALDFAYQTASALGAAHKKGIVHRDLKPDNLYIVADPHDAERERIKVLDFGIAKLQQGPGSDSMKTRTGTLMGTPIYMSPEQCRGTKTVDHRSDIYSLGIIFFEMMCGQPPFVSEGFGELVNMHLNVPAPSPRVARPEVPPALDLVILKMLAKSPDERYADMTELQAALKSAAGATIEFRGSSPDLGRTRPPKSDAATTAKMRDPRDTTFSSTGVGERIEVAGGGGRGKWIVGAVVVAAAAGGYFLFAGGGGDKGPHGGNTVVASTNNNSPSKPAAPAPSPAPVAAAPRPAPAAPAAPKQVTLRVESDPAGARVVNEPDGAVLGLTPLVLKRPPGAALNVRLEKDGYGASKRAIPTDSDLTIELTLEPKAKPRPHRPHGNSGGGDAFSEPAKL